MGAVADPADMIEELRASFEEMDVDGSGMIDADELTMQIRAYYEYQPFDGETVVQECIDMLLEADEDESGEVSFEEFAALYMEAAPAAAAGKPPAAAAAAAGKTRGISVKKKGGLFACCGGCKATSKVSGPKAATTETTGDAFFTTGEEEEEEDEFGAGLDALEAWADEE